MVRFETLAPEEKIYCYSDATVAADYKNGKFGTVASGVFTAGTGFYVIMDVEKGDDAHSADYVVKKGAHARIANLALADGAIVDITSDQLPSTVAVTNKLDVNSSGDLVVGSGASDYLEVIEVTTFGVRAKVVKAAEDDSDQ